MTRGEERILIERACEGDRASVERLVRSHQDALFAYIFRLSGRREMAEDVVQEAFVRALTHLDRFDPRFRFSTWLFTIAKRLYVNANQKLRPVYDTDAVGERRSAVAGPSAPVVAIEVRDNARDALDVALASLTEEQREIVVLFHQHDWPIALIADHMSMPEGTIKSHLHRSRRRMRRALEENSRAVAAVAEVWS